MKHLVFIATLSAITLSTASAALYVDEYTLPRLQTARSIDIPHTDFIGTYNLVPGLTPERFHAVDENDDGFLSPNEFKRLIF